MLVVVLWFWLLAPPCLTGLALRLGSLRSSLNMRDGSTASVFFKIGDVVRVSKDVFITDNSGVRLSTRGMTGTITDVWEKCAVDPHCCCAEQAFDAPFRIDFPSNSSSALYGLFAEDEFDRVRL